MNYIYLNGQKIELTKEQVNGIKKSFGFKQTKLADIPVGDTFKIGEYEFIVLEHSKETTAVIMKELYCNSVEFGTSNKFTPSFVEEKCNALVPKLVKEIGEENLITHTVDLTSNDGLKDYGKIKCKVSLLTADLYRRYVDILDKYKIDKWWWLATPYSTPTHNCTNYVLCVSPSGVICYDDFNFISYGVRPFCIFNSNIFVSK